MLIYQIPATRYLELSVVVKDGKITLKKGRDYTVKYKNNTKTGKATIVITGIGNYTGTKTISFNIIIS